MGRIAEWLDFIDTLPVNPIYIQSILYVDFYGLTCEQAAQRCNCPTGTLKRRLMLGREKVHKAASECYDAYLRA